LSNKRNILLCVLCALGTLALHAQPRLQTPEYYLGVHGGVSAGTVMFTPSVAHMTPITKACVLGGNGGLVFRYAGHKFCAFQMELNYLHRGWAETDETVGQYTRNLHYLELPILMHLNFGGKVCRWFFNLGPQIGYCIRDEGNSGVLVNTTGAEYAPIDHPFDWGLTAGTGLSFYTRHAGVYQLEVRFDFSLGGVYGTTITDHYSMANPMDLSLNLGWLFPVKDRRKAAEGTRTAMQKEQRQ